MESSDDSLPPSAREEIGYWNRELTLQGEHPEVIAMRIDPARRQGAFPPLLSTMLPMLRQSLGLSGPARCLEIGSGPLSTLAWGVDSGQLEVIAVDVLANEYAALLRRHGIDFPVRPVAGTGETLRERFPAGAFHLTYASNSLDHTDEAAQVFDHLVHLTVPGGAIVLQHHLNEGSHREWSASHKWNLDLGHRGLRATDRAGRQFELGNRSDLEVVYLCYRSTALDGWIDVVYRRTQFAR